MLHPTISPSYSSSTDLSCVKGSCILRRDHQSTTGSTHHDRHTSETTYPIQKHLVQLSNATLSAFGMMIRSVREDAYHHWSLFLNLLFSTTVFAAAVALNWIVDLALRHVVDAESIAYQWTSSIFDFLLLGGGLLVSAAGITLSVWAAWEPVVLIWLRNRSREEG